MTCIVSKTNCIASETKLPLLPIAAVRVKAQPFRLALKNIFYIFIPKSISVFCVIFLVHCKNFLICGSDYFFKSRPNKRLMERPPNVGNIWGCSPPQIFISEVIRLFGSDRAVADLSGIDAAVKLSP